MVQWSHKETSPYPTIQCHEYSDRGISETTWITHHSTSQSVIIAIPGYNVVLAQVKLFYTGNNSFPYKSSPSKGVNSQWKDVSWKQMIATSWYVPVCMTKTFNYQLQMHIQTLLNHMKVKWYTFVGKNETRRQSKSRRTERYAKWERIIQILTIKKCSLTWLYLLK